MSKIGTIHPSPAGATISPRLREREEWGSSWDAAQSYREQVRMDELRANAPPLSFADHLFNTDEPQS
jgi:hypothetical protein